MNDDSHDRWEELAAGHALDALEPEETEVFARHLARCERCQLVLAENSYVAAQLGTMVEGQDEAPSWERIRSGIVGAAPVASLDAARERRRSPRLLALAASLVLVAAGGAVAVLAQGDSADRQEQVLASCAASTTCHVVHLQGKADVVVDGDTVQLLPRSLGEPPAGRVFVLWQLQRDGRPTMIGTLGSTADGSVGEQHRLALPYDSTAAFGVSAEPADVMPVRPTDLVALGQT